MSPTTMNMLFTCPRCSGHRLIQATQSISLQSDLIILRDNEENFTIEHADHFGELALKPLGFRCMDCLYPDLNVTVSNVAKNSNITSPSDLNTISASSPITSLASTPTLCPTPASSPASTSPISPTPTPSPSAESSSADVLTALEFGRQIEQLHYHLAENDIPPQWTSPGDIYASGALTLHERTQPRTHRCMICTPDGRLTPLLVLTDSSEPLDRSQRDEILAQYLPYGYQGAILLSEQDPGIRAFSHEDWDSAHLCDMCLFVHA